MRQSIDICTATYSTIDHLSRLRPLCHGSGGPCKKKEKKQQHNNDDQQQSTLIHGRRKKEKKSLRVNAAAAVIRLPDIYSARPRTHERQAVVALASTHLCAIFID